MKNSVYLSSEMKSKKSLAAFLSAASKVYFKKIKSHYNGSIVFRGNAVIVALTLLSGFTAAAQTTYKWNKTGPASWVAATNWTPARNTPAVSDILVFDGNGISGTTTTVTNVPTETIGGLSVSNSTNVTFTSPAAAGVYTITVNNGAAVNDLSVATGCQLNIAGSRAILLSLQTGAKASISGNITFTNAAHQLLGADATSVVFNSPSVFTASTGFTGNAFGNSGTANTTVFSAGTSYVSSAGSDPFGLAAPASKIVFSPGSVYRANQANGAGVTLNGRTYGKIEFNGTGTANLSGTAGFTADSITTLRGTTNIGITGTSSVKGNINVARTTALNLNGNTAALLLNGSTQTIYGGGSFTLNNGQSVEVAVGTTVNLLRGITVTGATTSFIVKGTLNTRANLVSGTGIFNLVSGAFLGIGNTGGIAAAGTNSGSIRTTTRTYSASANYIYNGRSNQSTGNGLPGSINTLTINNSGVSPANVVALTAAVSITATVNSLQLKAGRINMNAKQLTIPNGGTVTATGGTFNTTRGPLAFAGTGTVTGTVSIPTVTVAGAVNFGAATTIVTSLQINTGGSVVTNMPLYNNGSALIYACGCSTFNTGREWMAGTTVGAGVPSNVTINLTAATNTLVLSGDRTVVSRLTLTNGNLSIGNNTLTLNGPVSRTAGFLMGSNNSSLVIGAAAGNLFFATGGTNNYLKNFTLNNAATAALSNALSITGGASAGTEGTLTVLGTARLTTRGFLSIKSNQFGTARIAEGRTTGGYISGNVTVERFVPKNTNKAWRLITAATTGQTIRQAWQENQPALVNGMPGYGIMIPGKAATLAAAQSLGFDSLSPGISLYKYNAVTDNLDPVPNTSTTQISSQPGYFIFIRGDRSPGQMGLGAGNAASTSTTLRSTGAIYQGNQAAVNVVAGKWALIRNPYASAIDLTKVILTGGVVDAYQVWDPKLNGVYGSGAYQTFTRSGANYVITPGGGSYGANGSVNNTVESGSAFFVQSTSTAGTVQVLESSKTNGSHLVLRPSGISSGTERLLFNLYANNTGSSDVVDGGLMFFDDAYSNAVDVNDVRKSFNFSENFGILKSNTELVVEKRPVVMADDTIYFKMYQMKQLSYTLEIVAENLEQPGMTAFLFDNYLGSTTPLNLNDSTRYDFTVDMNAGSAANNRFQIIFRPMIVLPVTFTSIKAAHSGNNIAVEWKVNNQVNISKYEIERSADGRNFVKVGDRPAYNAAGNEITYSWLDEIPFTGTNFYRVKSIGIDRLWKYTGIVKILSKKGNSGFAVTPNPVYGSTVNIGFAGQVPGIYSVRIVNMAGQLVYKSVIWHEAGNTHHEINLGSSIAKGLYQLLITTPQNVTTPEMLMIRQ
ncbi:MAG: T9SS type A sorting domain-containing protein [Chitinophagaceae bacterium]|nr:T9SS type A sorting domain-containing protein [Chitinophagaceae bacterium]